MSFASLVSCDAPLAKPIGTAAITALRPRQAEAGAMPGVLMELVVSIGAGLPVTRFGITARVSTGGGDYLKTGIWDEALPPGARAAVDLSFDFATAGESYLAGSAVIESAWFE